MRQRGRYKSNGIIMTKRKHHIRSTSVHHVQKLELYRAHTHPKDEGGYSTQPMKKYSNSKCYYNTSPIRTTTVALSYSSDEFICPVWAWFPHASKLDPELNDACRSITGYLRPSNVFELYLLAGIAPPDIRLDVCARVKKKKQKTNTTHSIYGQVPAERSMKRECIHISVQHPDFPAKVITQLRCQPGWKSSKGEYQSLDSVDMSQPVTHWCYM